MLMQVDVIVIVSFVVVEVSRGKKCRELAFAAVDAGGNIRFSCELII